MRIAITGGANGIGLAISKIYASRGDSIVILDMNKGNLEEAKKTCDLIYAANGKEAKCWILENDITKKECALEFAEFCRSQMNGIDILILNAGISLDYEFDDLGLDETDALFRQIMEVNFFSNVRFVKTFSDLLFQSKGQLVILSSGSGTLGIPRRSAYVASKHAVNGFFLSLRNEWIYQKRGVSITVICPSFVDTGIRRAAALAGRAKDVVDPESKKKMMTADECASKCIQAITQKKKIVHLQMDSWIASLFYNIPYISDLIDYFLRKKMERK